MNANLIEGGLIYLFISRALLLGLDISCIALFRGGYGSFMALERVPISVLAFDTLCSIERAAMTQFGRCKAVRETS